MPEWLAVIILGIVEGLTEFLPVSSTGHLLLFQTVLPRRTELFNIVIQSGAVLAVVTVFARRTRELLTRFNEPEPRHYLSRLALAFGVTAVGGVLLKKLGFELQEKVEPIAWATLIGGVLILLAEAWLRGRPLSHEITWGMALAAGAAQLVAGACPGTSRSGATILILLAIGLARPAATEFSFLLGIPTILAASAYKLIGAMRHDNPLQEDWGMLLLGTIVSGLTAFVVVKWLLRFVQSHTFVIFGWYRIVLGIVLLVYAAGWLSG